MSPYSAQSGIKMENVYIVQKGIVPPMMVLNACPTYLCVLNMMRIAASDANRDFKSPLIDTAVCSRHLVLRTKEITNMCKLTGNVSKFP